MVGRAAVTVAVVLGMVSVGLAAGAPSPSRPPARAPVQPSDYERGVQAVRSGDYGRAVTWLQRAVAANPQNADAWNYLGFSHRQLKQWDQALTAYQRALAINPNHLGAIEYLGELYLQTGDLDRAREQLARLKALCPAGCQELDDLQKAIRAYETARPKS